MDGTAFTTRPYHAVALLAVVVMAGCSGGLAGFGSDAEWAFEDATESAGLTYEADASGVGLGDSGVYVTDFNDDGWPDVLAIGGEEPVLFANDEGEFERSGALPDLDMTVQGALFFDADGDGREDLLVLPRNGEAAFLENDGGEFVRRENGLGVEMGVAVSASAADYDRDGDLDVFVIQNGDWGETTPKGYLNPEGGVVHDDNGAPNLLFENTDGGFERVEDAGIRGTHWSLATSFVDLTGDGYPDIHVANDFNHDTLYVNRGNGTFERNVMDSATARNGMSSEIGDFNADGRPDIFVTNIFFPPSAVNMSEERRQRMERYMQFTLRSKRMAGNNLMINRGGGEMSFEGEAYGVTEGGWGWASVHVDLDNDGDRDLFHATQQTIPIINREGEEMGCTCPILFERVGSGFERHNTSKLGFAESDGRGVAGLDFDRDGDQDLIVAPHDEPFKLYENNADSLDGRHSLQVRVVEANGETTAIGARVSVTANGTTQSAVLNAKADYLSQDTRVLHFGIGGDGAVDRMTVTWPDGTERTFEGIEADRRVVVSPNGTINSAPGS